MKVSRIHEGVHKMFAKHHIYQQIRWNAEDAVRNLKQKIIRRKFAKTLWKIWKHVKKQKFEKIQRKVFGTHVYLRGWEFLRVKSLFSIKSS
jgi:predicted transcriptional regulator